MIIMDRSKTPDILEHCNRAIETAPNVWAHARAMKWFHRMNTHDWEIGQKLLRSAPPGAYHWIASWPWSVAHAVNQWYPEVFNDTSGKTMIRFLNTAGGAYYKVPGAKV
ncbi:MAG: hypothetical protein ACXAEN_20145 [Candidatus Thorarchaeota archaeon]|jgi:hypothetical protein